MSSQGFCSKHHLQLPGFCSFLILFSHYKEKPLFALGKRAPVESLNIFRHVWKSQPCGKDLIYQSGINYVDIALGVTSSPCSSEKNRSIALVHFKILLRQSSDRSWAGLELWVSIYYWLFIRAKTTLTNHQDPDQPKQQNNVLLKTLKEAQVYL